MFRPLWRVARGGLAVGAVVWLAATGPAASVERHPALLAIGEMMSVARAMAEAGERGDLAGMAADAARVIDAGERALDGLPKPGNRHARDAADHVREAIESARLAAEAGTQGRRDEALAHVKRTMSHIRQGAGHAEAL